MRKRPATALGLLLSALALSGLGACGSSPATTGATSSASAASSSSSGAGGAATTFGASACGTCLQTSCASAITSCNSDPECATYLACVDACPVAQNGDVDPTCASACPPGAGSAALAAEASLATCKSAGEGSKCSACPHDSTLHNPYLNQKCAPTTDPNPCYQCEDSNCCETRASCDAVPDCKAYKDCVQACPTGKKGCVEGCGASHAKGETEFAKIWACMTYYCAVEEPKCDASMRNKCEACLYHTCGDLYADFVSDPAGYRLSVCVNECAVGDGACDDACIAKYPSAKQLFANVAACVNTQCKGC